MSRMDASDEEIRRTSGAREKVIRQRRTFNSLLGAYFGVAALGAQGYFLSLALLHPGEAARWMLWAVVLAAVVAFVAVVGKDANRAGRAHPTAPVSRSRWVALGAASAVPFVLALIAILIQAPASGDSVENPSLILEGLLAAACMFVMSAVLLVVYAVSKLLNRGEAPAGSKLALALSIFLLALSAVVAVLSVRS
jgi:hypothetical protein